MRRAFAILASPRTYEALSGPMSQFFSIAMMDFRRRTYHAHHQSNRSRYYVSQSHSSAFFTYNTETAQHQEKQSSVRRAIKNA